MEEIRPRFPERDYSFNAEVDMQEVDQIGFVNLNEALVNGIVPGEVNFDESVYNGVDEPGILLSRSHDVFDSLRKAEYVRQQLSSLKASEKEVVENAVERVVESSGYVTSEA